MDVDQFVHRLYLEHDPAHHEKIQPIALFNHDASVVERQQKLPLENQPGLSEFVSQTGFVGAFEQTWPKRLVNLDGQTQNPLPDLILFHSATSAPPQRPLRLDTTLLAARMIGSSSTVIMRRTLESSYIPPHPP